MVGLERFTPSVVPLEDFVPNSIAGLELDRLLTAIQPPEIEDDEE